MKSIPTAEKEIQHVHQISCRGRVPLPEKRYQTARCKRNMNDGEKYFPKLNRYEKCIETN